ncbi:urease accessory protein UreF [Sulfitobacter guttiformis]|nr:urease accessory UreF family protein [Sulfitobacter guttiformis]
MSTERDVLMLAQWLSPAFPVGSFAYSHGLEAAIQSGAIANAPKLGDWLADVLAHGSGRNDCILLRAAYAAGGKIERVNHAALAVSASAERVLETCLQGDAFNRTTAAIWGGAALASGEEEPLCYPVAVGQAAARMGIDIDFTAVLYLQSFAANLVSAAVRAVPLGQTEGQGVLAALTPLCSEIANATRSSTLDDLAGTAFLSDIVAMHHETLQPRIFRS